MKETDQYYLRQEEPYRGVFLALRDIVLELDKDISHVLKYGMPFFCYKGKMFCYFWVHKKLKQPYLGIVEGKRFDEEFLIQEGRSRMKIMLLDPNEDLPVQKIKRILHKAISFYKTGEIQVSK